MQGNEHNRRVSTFQRRGTLAMSSMKGKAPLERGFSA